MFCVLGTRRGSSAVSTTPTIVVTILSDKRLLMSGQSYAEDTLFGWLDHKDGALNVTETTEEVSDGGWKGIGSTARR